MPLKSEITTYISKPLIGAGLIYAYDIFAEGKSWNNQYTMYDSLLMGGTVLSSKLLRDILVDAMNFDEKSIQVMVIEPVANALLYSYLYMYAIHDKFGGREKLRDQYVNAGIAGLIPFILKYFENPIVSLFSGIKFV